MYIAHAVLTRWRSLSHCSELEFLYEKFHNKSIGRDGPLFLAGAFTRFDCFGSPFMRTLEK